MKENKLKPFLNLLLNPFSILGAVALGFILGITQPALSQSLSGYGDLYLALLEMCVLPVMVGAIVSSLGSLILANIGNEFIIRVIAAFIGGLLLSAFLALLIGITFKPGDNIGENNQKVLGGTVIAFELGNELPDSEESKSFYNFIHDIIPTNIFEAATQGKSLSLLFFSILLGTALGNCRDKGGDLAVKVATAVYEALLKIIGWLMYGLPIGLLLIIAGQVSSTGSQLLLSMFKLVIIIYVAALVMTIIYTLAISYFTKNSFWQSLRKLKSPLLIAFATSSSYAAIPSALENLSKQFKLEKRKADLVLPMGISLNPHGNVIYFVLAVIFVAQIYGQPIDLEACLIIVIAGTFAGIAAAGAPGIAALGMLTIVFEPLGLPVAIGIALLAAIDPIVDPILTMVNIHGNCATATILAKDTEPENLQQKTNLDDENILHTTTSHLLKEGSPS